jgi:two-component system, OmpR family, phosphate regulon sensor histidine kinase PhoR
MSARRTLALAAVVLGALTLSLTLPWIGSSPALAVIVAMAVLGAGMAMLEAWSLQRLMQWLRAPLATPAPLVEGAWGDLAYRVERLLDASSRELSAECQRRQEFLSAIEASPNGVMLLDAQEAIVWLNAPAADHFGLHLQRDLAQRVTNLVRQPAFVGYLQARVFVQPLLLALHDGRMLTITLRPYGDGALLLLSQDISERERAEAMRRDFVANASHEIRTPLAALSGFVESMSTLPLSDTERSRVLELMHQQAHRMQALVDDLLTLARLEGSPRPSAEQWTSLDAVLDGVLDEGMALSSGRHRLQWPMTSGLEVAGVESELHSALENLVSNAIRYTPAEGQIEVDWRLDPQGDLLVSVRDTGPGIAPAHLPRLTERFYRVDGSRSRETGGTGLGLSIVKHIAQRHGGQLRIDSEVEVGSCFTLVWPALRVRGDAVGESALGDEAAPALWARGN